MTNARCLPLLLLVACHPAPAPVHAPAAPAPTAGPEWGEVRSLLGTWEGVDPDTHARGRFTLAPELGGKVLVRHNVDDSARGHHEDLMIVFHGPAGLRAAYFDNEGHVIDYAVTATPGHVELLSDPIAGAPRFRLTYDLHGPDELAIDFAIAPPGSTELHHYAGATVHRVPDAAPPPR